VSYLTDQRIIEEILSRSITAAEVANRCGVAVQTVYRWIDQQEDLPVIFISTGPRRKTPFFPVPEIFQWFEIHDERRRGPR